MNNIKSMWNVINQKIGKNSKKKNNILYCRKKKTRKYQILKKLLSTLTNIFVTLEKS